MSTAETRLESIRPSAREDLRYITDLIGREPEPSNDLRVWNDAISRLQRVTTVYEALNDPALAQLGRACLEFTHLLASHQFADPSEACQRLLACLQILADHSPRVYANAEKPANGDNPWQQNLLTALGASAPADKTISRSDAALAADYQSAAVEHVQAYQEALLNWLTGRDSEQALTQLTYILQQLQPQMLGTPIADLAQLAASWRDQKQALNGNARQCLSRAERLLQQMAAAEDFSERANELAEKLAPLLAALPEDNKQNLVINIESVNQGGYWRPPQPAPADFEAWTGLAAALRDDLRYVIESLDVATRVGANNAPDMRLVSYRTRAVSDVLSATYMEDWALPLSELANQISKHPSRSECLHIAEQIQDVMACLEPEVIEQRQQAENKVSTRDAVAELSRTAVIDAALGSIARLSARFEIIATSDYRPNNLRPTEEIDALWGAARVLNWHHLSDAAAWLRDVAQNYIANDVKDQQQLLGTLLTGCVVVERFLQTVRLPWPDINRAENEMLAALHQLAPAQFSEPAK